LSPISDLRGHNHPRGAAASLEGFRAAFCHTILLLPD
jgi:hypothetical protein